MIKLLRGLGRMFWEEVLTTSAGLVVVWLLILFVWGLLVSGKVV
jgi:hypothetical protein